MKNRIAALVAGLGFALTAGAQDAPKAEVFLGYTYKRINAAQDNPSFSANGGGGQFVWNFNKWIGAVADLGAVHNGNIGGHHLDSTITNFLFGPRVPIRMSDRFTPYFHVLFGGVYASTSTKIEVPAGTVVLPPHVTPHDVQANAANAIALRASAQQTAFAMATGGGLDIKINKYASFRPIGLDYYLMRLQNLRSGNDNNQHAIRYTTGFNFTFGAR